MEAEEIKIGPCPFCGSDQAKLHESSDKYFYWVSCRNDDCITLGPSCQTREEAIEAWNAPNAKIADLEAKLAEALAACEGILRAFEKGDFKRTRPRQAETDPYHPALVDLRAAIAKARGEA